MLIIYKSRNKIMYNNYKDLRVNIYCYKFIEDFIEIKVGLND